MVDLGALLAGELSCVSVAIGDGCYTLRDGSVPWTSTSLPGSMRPEFGRTQYLRRLGTVRDPRISYDLLLWGCCLDLSQSPSKLRGADHGSVGSWHTLKAMGSKLGFCSRKSWVTSWVKGPVPHVSARPAAV